MCLEIYHRLQHIEINFYIRYIMSRHLYSTARQLLFPGGASRIVKKIRAPKFYLGLLEIMCWEPHGLQLFKVSVDPWFMRGMKCNAALFIIFFLKNNGQYN